MASSLTARAMFAKIPNRAFLRVTGTNSAQLLNGLISTTVPWPPAGGFYSAFLAANVCHCKYKPLYYLTGLNTGKDAIRRILLAYS